MALVDELRGYAKALGSDASQRGDIPLAQCSETMMQAAAALEQLEREYTKSGWPRP